MANPIPGDSVRSMACGASHSAIVSDGHVFVKGGSSRGALGMGQDTIYSPAFSPVPLPLGCPPPTAVSCGEHFTAVLLENGTLLLTGANESGQCGQAGGEDVHQLSVPRGPHPAPRLASIACGASFLLAIAADGAVWGMGDNSAGQLGTGDTVPRRALAPIAPPPAQGMAPPCGGLPAQSGQAQAGCALCCWWRAGRCGGQAGCMALRQQLMHPSTPGAGWRLLETLCKQCAT